jgi:hypothetical protein
MLCARFGRTPAELETGLTSEDFSALLDIAKDHPAMFWGVGGLG